MYKEKFKGMSPEEILVVEKKWQEHFLEACQKCLDEDEVEDPLLWEVNFQGGGLDDEIVWIEGRPYSSDALKEAMTSLGVVSLYNKLYLISVGVDDIETVNGDFFEAWMTSSVFVINMKLRNDLRYKFLEDYEK